MECVGKILRQIEAPVDLGVTTIGRGTLLVRNGRLFQIVGVGAWHVRPIRVVDGEYVAQVIKVDKPKHLTPDEVRLLLGSDYVSEYYVTSWQEAHEKGLLPIKPPDPEPTDAEVYLAGQKKWVEENNLEVGDYVENFEYIDDRPSAAKGWRLQYTAGTRTPLNFARRVTCISNMGIGVYDPRDDKGYWNCYRVLRKVPAPEPEVVYYSRDRKEGMTPNIVDIYPARPDQSPGGTYRSAGHGKRLKAFAVDNFTRIFGGVTPGYGDCGTIPKERYEELTNDK